MTSKKILLIVACWVFLSSVDFADGKKKHKGRHPPKHDAAADSSKVSLWGNFAGNLVYEGCFTLSGQPSRERTDSQNNNFYCNDFCKNEEKPFSATIGVRCLCLDALPSNRLVQGQCGARCPDIDYDEGGLCGGVGCCGGTTQSNAISVFNSGGGSKDKQSSKRTVGDVVIDIQGCFDDTQNGIIAASVGRQRTDSHNTALRCTEFCSGKGYAVASLRDDLCACTNDLPLHRLYEGSDGTKQCSTRCAGVFPDDSPCSRDECCGGGNNINPVYTVLVVGNVDVLKQVLSRLYSNMRQDPALHVLQDAFGDSICGDDWTYFRGSCIRNFTEGKTFSEAKEECESMQARLMVFKHEEDKSAFPITGLELYWVGLEFNKQTGTWIWATGEPLTYDIRISAFVEDEGEDAESCAQYSIPYIFTYRNTEFCTDPLTATAYVCQRFGTVSAVAVKRDSSGIVLSNYTMDLSSPDAITESTAPPDTTNILALSLEDLQEKIKKEESVSSEPIAGYDIILRNRDGQETAQLQYTHQIVTTESTAVTISGGMSYTIGVGTEFETSFLGLASAKIKAEFSTTGSWERGTTTTDVETVAQWYRFTFPVPAGCDATVSVLKEKIPTRIDWKAMFYITGRVDLQFMGVRKAVDISRIASAADRYVYGFGNSNFGERPTIVPKSTLDCIDQEEQTEKLTDKERELEAAVEEEPDEK